MRHQLSRRQRLALHIRRLFTEAVQDGVAAVSLAIIFGYIGYLMIETL